MIDTSRINLVPFSEEAYKAIFNNNLDVLAEILEIEDPALWTADEEVRENIPNYYQEFIDSGGNIIWGSFFYVLKDSKKLAGTGGFKGIPDKNGVVEIGYEILPGFKNMGYATEAADALVHHAFEHHASSVRAYTTPDENASIYVLRKLGMKYVENIPDPVKGEIWKWEINRPLNFL
ncbi:GNAT family N-acetyltransferase [Chondrinema litorale]|uniref:GNAT family N-acetyltransferase n=1 Tax=Chondrinema litorale TaxID=2994555 RepID=UPI00254337BE|nr:GNAT family N-acetyltransferase [Chondrinema litorale]UZR99366.1 GNAT family N-acetyltransferase [Chondrinema litorale]